MIRDQLATHPTGGDHPAFAIHSDDCLNLGITGRRRHSDRDGLGTDSDPAYMGFQMDAGKQSARSRAQGGAEVMPILLEPTRNNRTGFLDKLKMLGFARRHNYSLKNNNA